MTSSCDVDYQTLELRALAHIYNPDLQNSMAFLTQHPHMLAWLGVRAYPMGPFHGPQRFVTVLGRAFYRLRGALRGNGFQYKVSEVRAAMREYEKLECIRKANERD